MKIFKWVNEKAKNLNYIDIKIVACCGIFLGLILATWIHVNIWIWVILAILCYIWIIYRMFRK